MDSVRLDLGRLLGFKLIVAGACSVAQAKIGQKTDINANVAATSAKIGLKPHTIEDIANFSAMTKPKIGLKPDV